MSPMCQLLTSVIIRFPRINLIGKQILTISCYCCYKYLSCLFKPWLSFPSCSGLWKNVNEDITNLWDLIVANCFDMSGEGVYVVQSLLAQKEYNIKLFASLWEKDLLFLFTFWHIIIRSTNPCLFMSGDVISQNSMNL